MVQATLRWFFAVLGNQLERLQALAMLALVLLAALTVAALVLYALDRDGFAKARDWLLLAGRRVWSWWPLLVALCVALFAVDVAREAVAERFRVQRDARFSTLEDPAGGQAVQYGPNVSYENEVRYSRSVTIPGFLGQKLSTLEAAQLVAPYLVDPQSENIKQLADSFQRSGRDLVFTRDVVATRFNPVALETAEVNVDFSFGDTGAGRSYYNASFAGKYSFINPNDAETMVRFAFPLPDQSGTLADFELKWNGKPVPQADLKDGYIVLQPMPAKAKAEVTVRYKHQGANTWTYDFGQRREPIKQFRLSINTPRAVKFLRGSLFPNERGLSSLTWNLSRVITSQAVVLSFPERSLRETMTKVFSFAPFALLLAVTWTLVWAWRRHLRPDPTAVALMLLAFALGLGVMAVLQGYLPSTFAAWLGALLGLGLSGLVMGSRFLLPLAGSAFAPLAFLSVGNAGLLLGVLAVLVLFSLLPKDALSRFR